MKLKYTHVRHVIVIMLFTILLGGCAETEFVTNFFKNSTWESTPYDEALAASEQELGKSKGSYKVGSPYKVGRIWYYPKADFNLVETGIASWYGPKFHARQTANGEIFNQNALTAAHRTLQIPSFVKVSNLENGKSVIVRVNDRGPFKSGRVIDLSKKAATLLDYIDKGTARVKIQVMEDESRFLAEAAMRGEDTTSLSYNSVHTIIQKRKPKETYLAVNDNGKMIDTKLAAPKPIKRAPIAKQEIIAKPKIDSSIPESLMTPTITVEELYDNSYPIDNLEYKPNKAAIITKNSTSKNMQTAKTYSEANVTQGKPVKTGIFVQAGSFIVYNNANALAKELMDIAPTIVEPVKNRNGQEMYRVKLGPIATVAEADNILSRVIQAGSATALIIGKK